MTQTALTYRTNRDLFSNHYLTDHLRDTEPWNEVDDTEVQEAYDEIRELFEDKRDRVEDYNEAQLERNFIRAIFEILGVSYEIEETVERNARRPDYGFFETDEAADAAFDRNNFYEEAIAVADAKRWGRKLDTRGEEKRDFENPSYQIHAYLQETPTTWAVLTNGQKWRLYYGPTSHRLDSYYEIDLPTLLQHVEEGGSLEDFKDFYLFFRKEAFVEDTTGSSFLDDVYEESSVFAEALGEDLQDNIYEAIRVLAEGFLDTNDELDEDDLELIHDSSLIYLYRLIFVLYAESEGRDLLPTDNPIYRESYSLNNLKQTVAENRDETQQHYQSWQTNLWERLEELFVLIDQGSHGKGIPKDDLYIPAYNGGLFRTNPDSDDSEEAQFLANYEAGDAYLAEVIDLLTRREADEGEGQVFVDYSSLDERHLGSIYEGLLEYKLDVANEPLTVEDGEYTPANEGEDIEVSRGDVYLRTDAGERKVTGSYYTPEYVVEYIVDETLGPLVEDIRLEFAGSYENFADKFAERVFDLKVLDPAMGSGHFLVNAVDYLAREIIDAQERQDQQAIEAGNEEEISEPRTEEGELRDINWARRKVAQRCIYGVDLNPLATELAKVSLWLRTLAAEQPLAFLDHHLKTGNSLVGSDIEDVLANGDSTTEDGQLTLQQSFAHTRQQALEHVMDRFQDLLSIDNETLSDIKEMEEVYEEVREDPLYRHLLAMANVHTAERFGLNVPGDAYERMAEALRDDSWEKIEDQDWFISAQTLGEELAFFHWELEFPVAFYDEEGERKDNAGFDAVIGNPPYIRIQNLLDDDLVEYLNSEYQATHQNYDLAVPFTEKGYELLSPTGQFGYIETKKWIQGEYGEKLRAFLSDRSAVSKLVDFGDQQVFEGASTYTVLLFLGKQDQDKFSYASVSELEGTVDQLKRLRGDGQFRDDDLYMYPEQFENLGKNPWVFALPEERAILDRLENHETLADLTDEIFQGIITGADPIYILDVEDVGENTVTGYSDELDEVITLERDIMKPLLRGKSMEKWVISDCEQWVIFPYSTNPSEGEYSLIEKETMKSRYPKTWKYLSRNRDRLEDRSGVNKETWWQYGRPQNLDKFETEKLMTQVLAAESSFSIDKDGSYVFVGGGNAGGYGVVLSSSAGVSYESLLAILNSSLLEWTLQKESSQFRGGYYSYARRFIEKLPVNTQGLDREPGVNIDKKENDSIAEALSSLSEDIIKAVSRRQSLNVQILDYLGNYTEGPKLPDIGLFQPTSSNILNATTEDYEKHQVENARTERDGRRVTVYATARYKPENEDEFETDQWGYTETDYHEAFTLADLDEKEAALVEAFVPVAVEDEIAGFRDNATKNNSLIDRLKDITLPDPDDVSSDLQRYIEVRERAEELDKKIEEADQLIDEIVYDLYDLTEEETEIVEEAVNGDE